MAYIRKSESRGNTYYQFVHESGKITQLGNVSKLECLAQLVRTINKMDNVTVSELNQYLKGKLVRGEGLNGD